MLRVDLGQLGREGSVLVEASVSADDDLWKDTDLKWKQQVGVRLRAAFAGTGEVVARGEIRGTLLQEAMHRRLPWKSANRMSGQTEVTRGGTNL